MVRSESVDEQSAVCRVLFRKVFAHEQSRRSSNPGHRENRRSRHAGGNS